MTALGTVLKKLDDAEIDRDTLVFFLSDNGGPTKELTSSNAPLRGGKGTVYEGGIRIPFIVRWPGKVPAGKVEERAVISTDILPTALAAAGSDLPTDRVYDGVNFLPYLSGDLKGPLHEALYWRQGNRTALRVGDWKLLKQPAWRQQNASFELYNLRQDLSETTDLASKQPEKLKEMLARWNKLNDQMVEPIYHRPKK